MKKINNWYKLLLKADEAYALCTCGLSSEMPLCDGSHKGTGLKSLKIVVSKDADVQIRPLPFKVKPNSAQE